MNHADCDGILEYVATDDPLLLLKICNKCGMREATEVLIPSGMIACPTCKGAGTQLRFVRNGDNQLQPRTVLCNQCSGSKFLEESWKEVMQEGSRFRKARVREGTDIVEMAQRLGVDPIELKLWEEGRKKRPW